MSALKQREGQQVEGGSERVSLELRHNSTSQHKTGHGDTENFEKTLECG